MISWFLDSVNSAIFQKEHNFSELGSDYVLNVTGRGCTHSGHFACTDQLHTSA